MGNWRAILTVGLLFMATASCSGRSSGVAVSTPATDQTASGNTGTTAVPATTLVPQVWDRITAPANCLCSDGSGFHFYIHRADPTKVMFFLEGGGACFDITTCGPASNSFRRVIDHPDDLSDASQGIFDFTDPRNPFKDWSVVYLPYCTGDVHLGNTTHDYGSGVVIHHNGYVNASTVLSALSQFFPNTEQLMVVGESAGSVAAPLYAGMARDLLPNARITVLADGSGAYPDIPAINTLIGTVWGTVDAIPSWPENRGQTLASWSIPGLFVQAHRHAPAIVFARHDYAFDSTQSLFAALAGIPADNLVALIDRNEQQIEAVGMQLFSFISPGDRHTVLQHPDFYTETVNGSSLLRWVSDLVAGTVVADVHCTDCKNG